MNHVRQYLQLMANACQSAPVQQALYQWESKNVRRIKIVSYASSPKLKSIIDKGLGSKRVIKQNQCFHNALLACFASPHIQYVEGYIVVGGLPLEHAWNRWRGIDFDLTQEILEQKKLPHYEVLALNSPNVHFWASKTGLTGPYRVDYFYTKVNTPSVPLRRKAS